MFAMAIKDGRVSHEYVHEGEFWEIESEKANEKNFVYLRRGNQFIKTNKEIFDKFFITRVEYGLQTINCGN